MSGPVSIAERAPWLSEPGLQRLLACLSGDGEGARIVGGAVRNTLLGQDVTDIDIATTCVPEETTRRAEAEGFRVVQTGAEHGTVTVIAGGIPHEVTTLRADVETDGRRAVVDFGRDWKADAARRDFTINALYADADGTVVDFVGGIDDIRERRLRFIGDAETRIREDYLRILRFFRFFAWYGDGRPDAEGIKASARLKDGLSRLSAERIWSEFKKLLSAPDPSRALLWMRQTGVLTAILPESDKWGIDAIHSLIGTEHDLGWDADAILRLEAIVPPDAVRLEKTAERLRLSNAEAARLTGWATANTPPPDTTDTLLASLLYRENVTAVVDRLRLALAGARAEAATSSETLMKAGAYARLLDVALTWEKPVFPISGKDVIAAGVPKGPEVGRLQRAVEEVWVASDFRLERDQLLAVLREHIAQASR